MCEMLEMTWDASTSQRLNTSSSTCLHNKWGLNFHTVFDSIWFFLLTSLPIPLKVSHIRYLYLHTLHKKKSKVDVLTRKSLSQKGSKNVMKMLAQRHKRHKTTTGLSLCPPLCHWNESCDCSWCPPELTSFATVASSMTYDWHWQGNIQSACLHGKHKCMYYIRFISVYVWGLKQIWEY